MKQQYTTEQLRAELARQMQARQDFLADTRFLDLVPVVSEQDGSVVKNAFELAMSDTAGNVRSFAANDLFHRQTQSLYGIPAPYYDRMRSEFPELLTANVRAWMQQTPETRMIRTLDGNARANLSKSYRPLDNAELFARAVMPSMSDIRDLEVASAAITETRLYVKFTTPRVQLEVKRGDVVQAGFVITNSEVGHSSLSVKPFVTRLVCLNGATVDAYAQTRRHSGSRNYVDEGDGFTEYASDTRRAMDEATWRQLRDTMRTMLNPAKFEQIVSSMRETAGAKIEGGLTEAVAEVKQVYGLNEQEQADVLKMLSADGDHTLWGLGNAVTAVAREVESYDRASELERIGGKIFMADKATAKRLLTAGV